MKAVNYRSRIYLLLILLGCVTFFSSCSDDYSSPIDEGSKNNGKDIVMTFQMPKTTTAGGNTPKAISAVDENKISEIDVLAFKQDAGKWVYTYKSIGTNITDAPEPNENKYKKQFNVEVLKESFDQQFVIIANARRAINDITNWEQLVGTEKEALLEMLVFENPNASVWKATSSSDFRAFPMWGETIAQKIDENTKTIGGIKVLRAISRVDIALGTEAQKTFELTDVYIYNTKTRGYVVPKSENLDNTGTAIKAQVPPATGTVPHNDYDSNNPNLKALKYKITTPISFEREIYLLEASAVADMNARDAATCLVIGGKYNGGETTWYRVDNLEDIKDATGNIVEQKYKDFLRNHQYRFNILSVNGPGHPEPEISFKEKTINMVAEIKEWDDGKVGDIYFDGQNYISVNPGIELNFMKDAASKTDTIKTDVVAGFKITGITYKEGSSSGWISIDKPLNTALGMSEEEVPLKVDVTQNNDGKERVGYIHIEAGRLRLKITVTQGVSSKSVFEFISMDNVNGQGLAIPRAGGQVVTTVKSNIKWKLKALRGNNPVYEIESEEPTSEATENSITLDIDPLTRFWKDDQLMDTEIDVWIEYILDGEIVVAQKATFYQVPYDIKPVNLVPTSINKYGEVLELEFKGYFPKMPFRVIDEEGNYVSDIVYIAKTGDIVNNDVYSSKIKFLVYSNYSGRDRQLSIQYERPLVVEGDPNAKEWKELATVMQEKNGLTLPTAGYKATRGVLGIGAKTGKLRLDGSNGLYGGTATYIDKNGNPQPEDVYMVCFTWGSLFALKAEMLNQFKDQISVSSIGDMNVPDGKIESLNDFIAWLPPGYLGDINNLPLHDIVKNLFLGGDEDLANLINQHHYLRIPTCWGNYFPAYNDLSTGIGDPCRAAQNEVDDNYGDYRTPWGTSDGNHEALLTYGGDIPAPELGADNLYFMQNAYYQEADRQYLPAYALVYSIEQIMYDENGEDLEQPYIMFSYKADYPNKANRRIFYSYWTSVKGNQNTLNENAFMLYGGVVPGDYHSFQNPKYVYRNAAMPVRCVK